MRRHTRLMLSAIALPGLRVTVLSVALFSTASFIVVAIAVGGYNPAIGRVVVADVVASVLLAAGLAAELWLVGKKMTYAAAFLPCFAVFCRTAGIGHGPLRAGRTWRAY